MSLIAGIKQKVIQQSAEQKETFRQKWQVVSDNPLLFSALIVSGFLSHLAGWFIGLGVQVDNGVVSYTLDAPHIFVAALYAILFPFFFEYGLANWLSKNLKREVGNSAQQWASGCMVAFTGLGALMTAFSAADIIATTLGFFTSFTEIPPEVQRWMVFSLPAMLACNVLFGEIYRQNSLEATLMRHAEMEIREKRIEADMNVRIAQMTAKADIATHTANQYAKSAGAEVSGIGSKRGEEKWKEDRKVFQPVAPVRQYSQTSASSLELVSTEKNPTEGQES
jgi:hypothetical protein